MMELIPKDIEATIPALYSQEHVSDPVAVLKLFDPCGRYSLYVLEGSRQLNGDLLLFGFCRSHARAGLRPVGVHRPSAMLRAFEGRSGWGIERDLYFSLTPLSEIRERSCNPR